MTVLSSAQYSTCPCGRHRINTESESFSCSVMSNSSRPLGWQPTRLLCPWNFPGKNTGVGYHSLLWGSSRPRDPTCISCIEGRLFTAEPLGKCFCSLALPKLLFSGLFLPTPAPPRHLLGIPGCCSHLFFCPLGPRQSCDFNPVTVNSSVQSLSRVQLFATP